MGSIMVFSLEVFLTFWPFCCSKWTKVLISLWIHSESRCYLLWTSSVDCLMWALTRLNYWLATGMAHDFALRLMNSVVMTLLSREIPLNWWVCQAQFERCIALKSQTNIGIEGNLKVKHWIVSDLNNFYDKSLIFFSFLDLQSKQFTFGNSVASIVVNGFRVGFWCFHHSAGVHWIMVWECAHNDRIAYR